MIKKQFIISLVALGLILVFTGCGSSGDEKVLRNMVFGPGAKDTDVIAIPFSDKVPGEPNKDLKDIGIEEAVMLADQVWGFEGLLVRLKREPGPDDGARFFSLASTHDYTHSARVNDDDTHIYLYAYCPNDGARSKFIEYLEALRNPPAE